MIREESTQPGPGADKIEYSKHTAFISSRPTIRAHNIILSKTRQLIRKSGGRIERTSLREEHPEVFTTKMDYLLPKGIIIELPEDHDL